MKRRCEMGYEQMMDRMSYLLPGENLQRVRIGHGPSGEMIIRLDLHGMRVAQARRVIEGILLLSREDFLLDLIHGYSHGTALKELIFCNLQNTRIRERRSLPHNPGETLLRIAAA